jgi:hypothetical protein
MQRRLGATPPGAKGGRSRVRPHGYGTAPRVHRLVKKIRSAGVRRAAAVGPALLASALLCQLSPWTGAEMAFAAASLKIEAHIRLPATGGATLIAAEAPDGAVFSAQGGKAGTAVVWVVDGDGPAAVSEHVSGGVQALAADSENLYVATYKMLIAFSRRTGRQVGEWALPKTDRANAPDSQLISLSAWNGHVSLLATRNDDVNIYRINAGSAAGPRLVGVGTSAAFGPDGSVFFARQDHHISYMSAAGTSAVGPKLAHHPNGLGGGVQFIDAVAGGVIWVAEPAGQGLDATFTSYNQRTLKPIAHWDQPIDGQIASTAAGTLVLGGEGYSRCPGRSQVANDCVYRLSATGVLTTATPVGSATVLLGPDPAVITTGASGTVTYLDRLT